MWCGCAQSLPHLENAKAVTTQVKKSRFFHLTIPHLCNLLKLFAPLFPTAHFRRRLCYLRRRAMLLPFRFFFPLLPSKSAPSTPKVTAAASVSDLAGCSASKSMNPSSCASTQSSAAQESTISVRRPVFAPAAIQPANAASAAAAAAATPIPLSPIAPFWIAAASSASSASSTASPVKAPRTHFLQYHPMPIV